jgi:hypothetical protein
MVLVLSSSRGCGGWVAPEVVAFVVGGSSVLVGAINLRVRFS